MQLTPGQLLFLVRLVGVPPSQQAIAIAIALAESGGNPYALANFPQGSPGGGPEVSVGLWQINVLAHPEYTVDELYDSTVNARAMYAVSRGGTNWFPWSTFTSGAYRDYLGSIERIVGNAASPAPAYDSLTSLRTKIRSGMNPIRAAVITLGETFNHATNVALGRNDPPGDLTGGVL